MRVVLQIRGSDEVAAAIRRAIAETRDLRPLWRRVRDAFFGYQETMFATGGEGRWEGLAPSYAAWKRARYPGKRLLEQSGAFMRSLTSRGPWTVYRPTPQRVTLGTGQPAPGSNLSLANIHAGQGRQIIDADSPVLHAEIERAVDDWAAWMAEKWGER